MFLKSQLAMTLSMGECVRAQFAEYVCDIVIFLYKVGEALLDASIRPFIAEAVCNDIMSNTPDFPQNNNNNNYSNYYNYGDGLETNMVIVKDRYRLLFHGGISDGGIQHGDKDFRDVCSEVPQHVPPELRDGMEKLVAAMIVVYRTLVSVPAVILGLFCGAWSDSRGYKMPMMSPSVGSCLGVIFYVLSAQARRNKVALLLSGATMQGLFGKTSVITMAVNSHVSHTSDSEQRTRRLGRLLASNYLGMFVGSLLSGFLQDETDLGTTLAFVSLFHALCVVAIILGVTEIVGHVSSAAPTTTPAKLELSSCSSSSSVVELANGDVRGGGFKEDKEGGVKRKEAEKEEEEEHGLFSWEGLKGSVMAVVGKREGHKRAVIVICLVVLIVTQILKIGDQDITVLFVDLPPLSWPSYLYGYLLAADSGIMGLTLLLLLPLLSHVRWMTDRRLVLLGVVCRLARSLWAGFCTSTWMLFMSVVIGAVGGIIAPGLRSILSKTAEKNEVGKLFSIQASLETLAKLLGSGIFTSIFAMTVDIYPPIAYLSEVAVYLVIVVLLIWLKKLHVEPEEVYLLSETSETRYTENNNKQNDSGGAPASESSSLAKTSENHGKVISPSSSSSSSSS